jgi:hypothetical protein
MRSGRRKLTGAAAAAGFLTVATEVGGRSSSGALCFV